MKGFAPGPQGHQLGQRLDSVAQVLDQYRKIATLKAEQV